MNDLLRIVYYFAKVFNSLIRERLAGCHDIYFLCVFGCDPQCLRPDTLTVIRRNILEALGRYFQP